MQLKDTVFYVTGGASGLGAATVRALHARGALVGLWDLDVAGGEALAKELDGSAAEGSRRIVVSEVDVCEEDDVVNAIAACDKQWPKSTVGGCVNCGGVGMAGKVSA
jgi:NAD(P)-dependent dehydrogenase (short-subunit alcohol dehydrogenase family)